MKKKRVIVIIVAAMVTALFVWRMWPYTMREVLGSNGEPFDKISVQITEFGVVNNSLQIDVYKAEISSVDAMQYDEIVSLIEGIKFRQDLRNLLPWDINTVSSGEKSITHSANLMLTGAGLEGGCHITFHGDRIVSFSKGADSEFLVYHPVNRAVLDQLVAFTKEHGVLQG